VNGVTVRQLPEHRAKPDALAIRAGSAVVLAVPVVAIAFVGSPVFEAMVIVAAGVLVWEWCRLCAGGSWRRVFAVACGAVVAALTAASLVGTGLAVALLAVGAAFVLAMTSGRLWPSVGPLYIGLPCLAFLWLRDDPIYGRDTVLWLLAVVWSVDIGAYAVGRLVGGPKLAPSLSPNKTWAGLLGGLAAAAIAGVAAAALGEVASASLLIAASVAVGAVAQGGDLFESWAKRRFGVKDASRLIPGHGGLLDRVDGLMAASLLSALIVAAGNGSILTWN
jgi:phosphatidate cytidylyltransferase